MKSPLLLLALAVAGSTVTGAPEAEPLLLTLYAEANAQEFPGAVRFEEHCCCEADLVSLYVTNMLEIPPDVASGEAVLEIDAQGNTINKWVLPVDGSPVAVEGDDIYALGWLAGLKAEPDGEPQRSLVVSLSGVVGIRPLAPSAPQMKLVACPEVERFEGSAYLECAEFEDLATGARRLLAFQHPCT